MPCSQAQKRANYKWIANNRDEWNSICKLNSRIYYERNIEKVRQRKLEHYYAMKEFETFRKILL